MGRRPIVAIDGPSGAGKSTVARIVADRLGFLYIDTGAMYRAFGLHADRRGLDFAADDAVRRACEAVSIRLERDAGALRVFLDGADVTAAIRTPEASMAASRWSAHPAVREAMTRLQREMGAGGGVVMEGRDIGSVVFPDAECKFYLTASEDERARRRHRDLIAAHESPPTFESVRADIRRRDADDSTREHAPLTVPDGAIPIESTSMSIDEVVESILAAVQSVDSPR